MSSEWHTMDTAPRDETTVLLWVRGRVALGSFREDDNMSADGPMWLADDHDDYSTGFASTPLRGASHWQPLPDPPLDHMVVVKSGGTVS